MTPLIIGIDPGTTESGVVGIHPASERISSPVVVPNGEIIDVVCSIASEYHALQPVRVGVEMIASYGMAVGREVFETCVWIGSIATRIPEAVPSADVRKVYRLQVKKHVCHNAQAKDANIRQAIIDRYEPIGGGRIGQIGTKNKPGPLYGVKSHVWAALGVAITARDTWEDLEPFSMISEPIKQPV